MSTRSSANNNADLLFAVSNDANPLDGFSNQYVIPSAASGDLADFPKFGYNADYITFSANDFGSGDAKVTVINKADALAGTPGRRPVDAELRSSAPSFPPSIRRPSRRSDLVHRFSLPWPGLDQQRHAGDRAARPLRLGELHRHFRARRHLRRLLRGSSISRALPARWRPTTTRPPRSSEYGNTLVTAIPASTAADGILLPEGPLLRVQRLRRSPALTLQGVIDNGPGVADFFPTVAMNPTTGDLGLTWMQSSSNQYVSMYVGTVSGYDGRRRACPT